MNQITLTGNLTADPELRYSQSGKAYCRFTLAVTRTFDREKTDFFNCTAFGKTAENLEKYQRKGNKLLVVGEVHIDKGNDDKWYTSVTVSNVEYLTPRNQSQAPSNDPLDNLPSVGDGFVDISGISDEELPF